MLKQIDWVGRRCVAYPMVFVGMCLTVVSKWLIIGGAWLMDIKIDDKP